MANPHFYALIMAGGSGERFWPLSRHRRPKHLLPIVGDAPMIAQTVERLKGLIPPERVLVLTQAYQIAALRRACPAVPARNFYAEPMRRDTAAAIALGAVLVARRDPKAVFAVLPADAYVKNTAAFRSTLKAALVRAQAAPVIVTVGVPPTRPAVAYGYLEAPTCLDARTRRRAVKRFVEKPDEKTARAYLRKGGYYWNAGIFVWALGTLRDAFCAHCPELANALFPLVEAPERKLARAVAEIYPKLKRISVDYAVMEKSRNIEMVAASFDWDDVGEWTSLARHAQTDAANNLLRGDVVACDAADNIACAETGHTVALCGVKNLVVVQTADATLVCDKAHLPALKHLLEKIPPSKR